MSDSTAQETTGNQFGTFGGVFTPSILTILGVVMFMRTGFVTGQAGILIGVAILALSKFITFLTGLSISAISTNTRVKGGGAYFLISRSLGPEFGASIGLALFLAQALSVPFYVLGFVEAMTTTQPHLKEDFLMLGVVVTTFLFALNYVGSGWAIRAQYLILGVLVASIVGFLGGGIWMFDTAVFEANLSTGYTEPQYNFWTIFAVFFPAVTGIMAGVNMSGDLKEPERSIPRGTLFAIGAGALVYFLQIVIMGGVFSRQRLIDQPYETLLEVVPFNLGVLVVAGVYAATLSSAIGSMMGAPRILQALARDRIFPILAPFAQGTEQGDEPRNGLWLTLVMTIGVLFIAGNGSGGGALNAVASVLTMFFLFTYGMTNFAAFIEQLSRNPSFRPRFRYFHWMTALLGGIGCLFAAFLINPIAALAALGVIVVIFLYVSNRVLTTEFGDARRGFYYERVRANMKALASLEPHPKNWRPTTLVLTGNPRSRLTLSRYAGWLASEAGIVTLASVIEGDIHENLERRREMLAEFDQFIEENALGAFSDVHVSSNFEEGLSALIQSHSIGPLKPNMILMGWSGIKTRARWFGKHLRLAQELGMSQVVLFDRGVPELTGNARVDVWWRGRKNGSLMAILTYLLTSNWEWRHVEIRVLRIAPEEEDVEVARQQTQRLIDEARMTASVKILQGVGIKESLREHSSDAAVVFLGFQPPDDEGAEDFFELYESLTDGMPTTLIVSSSGEADLLS